MSKWWNTTSLIGGGTRAVDSIATTSLSDGDIAETRASGVLWVHKYNATGTAAESSPDVIRPDDYGSAGNWEKQSITSTVAGVGTMPSGIVMSGVVGFDASHGTDATNDIDFAIGAAMDSTNTASINSTTVITKRLDAAWAAGTGNGGNLSAAAGVASHLYLWVAMGSGVTGDADLGFWDTVDGTALATRVTAAGFTYYKVLGFRHVTSGTAWAGFTQNGDHINNWIASENILSTGVTTSYAVVDHTSLVSENYIELIEYGVRDASEDAPTMTFSDDGTNNSGTIGVPAGTVTDTSYIIWGKAVSCDLLPYSATREFITTSGTIDLLLKSIKFKR